MPPPDSSSVDSALVAKLLADVGVGGLMALMPDGVFFDVASPGANRFVIVSVADEVDVGVFGRPRAYEDTVYLVKAVALSSTGGDVRAAAARIDLLLDDGSLEVDGYTLMMMRREKRIRQTEVDDVDASIRWLHRGGHYRVQVTPD